MAEAAERVDRETLLRVLDGTEQAIHTHPIMSEFAKKWAIEGVRDVRANFGCRICGSAADGSEGFGTHKCRSVIGCEVRNG